MPANSAIQEGIKRQTITNELIRRIFNCSRNQPETEAAIKEATNDYMEAMKISGYDEKTRKETVVAAFKGIAGKLRQASEENKPLHRHKEDGAGDRFKRKISAKSNWFNKRKKTPKHVTKLPTINTSRTNKKKRKPAKPVPTLPRKVDSRPIESVVFIPYTKGGRLQKELQSQDDKLTASLSLGRTCYVERAGTKLKEKIVNKNPWTRMNGGCGRQTCYPCKSTKGAGISCRHESVCYELVCLRCEENKKRTIYIGETSTRENIRTYEAI